MPVSVNDVFVGGQLLQSHGSPGVELLGGNARGPMGLAELCSYKYIIHGNGQIR